MKIKVKFAVLFALGVFAKGANGASEEHARASYEVWDLPETGLVQISVPKEVGEAGELQVSIDGVPACAQEILGAGACIVKPTAEQRTRSRTNALTVTLTRQSASPVLPRRVDHLVVSNAAFQLTFDAKKRGGLPSRLVWASGKVVDNLNWGDRVFAEGAPEWVPLHMSFHSKGAETWS